jgi:hypothetical protein
LSVPKNEMAEYTNVREIQALHQNNYNGNQAGDPVKAAEVLIEIAEQKEPPLHLFLGKDAYQFAEAKISAVEKDMNKVRELATSTDYAQEVVA